MIEQLPTTPQGVGAALVTLLLGAGGAVAWWTRNRVTSARQDAEYDVVQLMRDELARLAAASAEQQEALIAMGQRIRLLEHRETRLIQHIGVLEHLMREAGLVAPPFDINGSDQSR